MVVVIDSGFRVLGGLSHGERRVDEEEEEEREGSWAAIEFGCGPFWGLGGQECA